ncbi:hypothetical protein Q8W71_17740 [Methylobacterium sp. NEAU 140]|uniref:hypothetical protein n=1 Tax=Methylobacterium sp. NEAU 140 TaxID=3064945 RepID=UPI002732F5A5|nr:hypothetical protein [Methylobacterium sp. NEAU 140]MDP4024471.1 hypothetical protein [Methylobacterium sp. NEAU 140]
MTCWLTRLLDLLGVGHYRPSAYALASDPVMMALFVSGWAATALACIAVGVALMARRWAEITMSAGAARFYGALFILLGLDFLMSATTVFIAVYRLKVLVLGITAAVMVTTAIVTIGRIYGAQRGGE